MTSSNYLGSLPFQLSNGVSSPSRLGGSAPSRLGAGASADSSAVSSPKARLNMSPQEWDLFQAQWNTYKSSTEIHETRLGRLLYFTCEPQLQKKVCGLVADPMEAAELDMLAAIKTSCLAQPRQTASYAVRRRDFVYIHQNKDEPATRYVARLRIAASLCNWRMCSCRTCPGDCGADAGEEHVRDQLLRGMADKDLQRDLMERDETFRDTPAILSAMMARENARARATSEDKEIKEQSSVERKNNVDYSDLVGKLLLGLK